MINVLIVEDDPMVRQINEKFLEKISGFNCIGSVSCIATAKERIVEEEPHLILLDLFFPNEKGQDLMKWLRSEGKKTDCILITADNSAETIESSLRFGAVDYLIKPFTFERFRDALLRYQGRKEGLSQSIGNIEQDDIDRFVFFETDSEKDLPLEETQFSKQTYEKVLEYLSRRKGESFTAQEVADFLGVSRITARRYLDLLEKENAVIMDLEYGKIGRPKNKYRIKE